MNRILVVKKGSLSKLSKDKLPKDITLIEVDNVNDVKLLEPSEVGAGIIIKSAIKALSQGNSDYPARYFVNNLNKELNG